VSVEWFRWTKSKINEGKKVKLQVLNWDWWVYCTYFVSFIAPIVKSIHYIDIDALSFGEIYETFDNVLV
jgi:hypothetical protein